MRVPSGDQRAAEPFVRKRCLLPSAFMMYSADSNLSFILSTQRRVNTICLPSGEIWGSDTFTRSRYIPKVTFFIGGLPTSAAVAREAARRMAKLDCLKACMGRLLLAYCITVCRAASVRGADAFRGLAA